MADRAKKQSIREGLCLFFYLAGFAVLCGLLIVHQHSSVFMPSVYCPPDEADRYLIPRFIYEFGRLPIGPEREVAISGYGGSYAYLPGLSYILMAGMMRIASLFSGLESTLVLAARSVNLILGLIQAVYLRRIAKRLFSDAWTGWLFCTSILYLPQMIFVHSYVNLDALGLLSITLMLYYLLAMSQDGVSLPKCVGLSAGVVFCLLSYYNCYAFLPGCALLFLFLFLEEKDGKRRYNIRKMLQYSVPVLFMIFLGAGWWFIRSAAIHDGDFLGLRSLAAQQAADRARVGIEMTSPLSDGISFFEFLRTPGMFFWLFCSFIGGYGAMSIFATKPYYLVYVVLYAAAAVGLVLRIRKEGLRKERLPFYATLLLGALINVALWMYYSYAMDYQAQGRYVLPSVIPFAVLIVSGWEGLSGLLPEKVRRFGIPVLMGVLLILSFFFVLLVGLPRYEGFSLLG
ncbi:MAG: hypothetical protein K6E50_15270 [Lachnospiraceae bacterium]|nr:hypothetical protein [Lachnospiraceae bacterium]